jgi:hypothetical protein
MNRKTTLIHLALGAASMLAIASTGFAQSANGTLRGTVLDPSGALIPGARITISTPAGLTRSIKSSPTGTFKLTHLTPGTYSVAIDAIGFTPALEGGIQVAGNKVTREDVKLGISVYQQIEVSANDADANADAAKQ